jgi:hypothetical protein
MCSKKCAKPVRSGSYSSRDPVRTIDQYAASPSLGIGTTMAVSPFGSVRVSVGNGMMGVTAEVSWLGEGSVRQAAASAEAHSRRRSGGSTEARKVMAGFYSTP